jgi:hypothetical protein
MSIEFVCPCGRHFSVPDQLAGKTARCRNCQATIRVPVQKNRDSDRGLDEAANNPQLGRSRSNSGITRDRRGTPDEEDCKLELVDDEAAESKGRPRLNNATDDEERERFRRRRKKNQDPEQDKGMAAFYMSQTPAELSLRKEEMKEKKKRKRRERGYDDDDDDDGERLVNWAIGSNGLTMFGVHFTAGVIGGSAMLVSGLMFLTLIVLSSMGGLYLRGRILGGALAYTIIGAGVLVRSLFYGEED